MLATFLSSPRWAVRLRPWSPQERGSPLGRQRAVRHGPGPRPGAALIMASTGVGIAKGSVSQADPNASFAIFCASFLALSGSVTRTASNPSSLDGIWAVLPTSTGTMVRCFSATALAIS